MAHYAGQLLAPAEKRAYYAVFAHSAHFWCSVVTLVTFISNLKSFEKIKKKKNIYIYIYIFIQIKKKLKIKIKIKNSTK